MGVGKNSRSMIVVFCWYLLQNVMASEFKEKMNNVLEHLAGRGGVVTDDSLRR